MRAERSYPEGLEPDRRESAMTRLRIVLQGAVQGVGFRPFVFRLATTMGLPGWVRNSPRGVQIEVEGSDDKLAAFLDRLQAEAPPRAQIVHRETAYLPVVGYGEFTVRDSDDSGEKAVVVLPDVATCDDCLREISDPSDRRYRYPFTNCTNCGPRYSIIESVPYDRSRTTMKIFAMCDQCRAEYEDPRHRRFHAQPNACPECGPQLELWDTRGQIVAARDEALLAACDVVRLGRILALKGLGGFQLIVNAFDDEAVRRLRLRKVREEKPLALMFPDLKTVQAYCEVTDVEQGLLVSYRAPIVLLRRRTETEPGADKIAVSVAPDNPYLGVMLPYTPLHYLLMKELDFPIVATSGNLSDEPICIDEHEALARLGKIADLFLVHNRPIARQMDDSVVHVVHGREQVIRGARGYAPVPIYLTHPVSPSLAVGAHLKNVIAIASGKQVFLSQHVGDLETTQACTAMETVAESLSHLYDLKPSVVVCDLHPDYASSQYAADRGKPVIRVQHHYAHVLACMTDNDLDGPVLGVAWDGTGLGTDMTIWGGEFLTVDAASFSRVGHLRTFVLPGGEKAVEEPRRAAIGLLYGIFGGRLFTKKDLAPLATFTQSELNVVRLVLEKKLNCPTTSSAGRLFDAVASLLNIRHINAFNGQAAMLLGFAAEGAATNESYEIAVAPGQPHIVDWEPMIRGILADINHAVEMETISAKFHNTLAEITVEMARQSGEENVVLTGGCFQNRYLSERAIMRLTAEGFHPHWHHVVPPNDGGIAAGQIVAASRELQKESQDVSGHSGQDS